MDIGIGELSQLTGVKIPTIRYYEQIGLLRERSRSKGNQWKNNEDQSEKMKMKKIAFIGIHCWAQGWPKTGKSWEGKQ